MNASDENRTHALIGDRIRSYPFFALYNIVGITSNLLLILAYGSTSGAAGKAAMSLSVIAVAAISTLPVRSLFADIAALTEDLARTDEGAYVRGLRRKPIKLFVTLTIAFNALIALTQLWTLFTP